MRSIRRNLIVSLAASLASLVILGGALLYVSMRTMLLAELDATLAAKARVLATLLELDDKGSLEFEFADELMPEFQPGTAAEYFEIRLGPDRVVERSRSLQGGNLAVVVPGTIGRPGSRDILLPDGRPGRAVGIEFRVPHEHEPEDDRTGRQNDDRAEVRANDVRAAIVVARERDSLNRTLLILLGALAVTAVLLPLLAVIAIRIAVQRSLRPVTLLAGMADTIDASSLEQRFPTGNLPVELQPISHRLNDLLGRLEGAFNRERRFSDAAAHELRTPIAELRALSEIALKWPDDIGQMKQSLGEAVAISGQMERLVTNLLAITRGKNAGTTACREQVDLVSILGNSWQLYTPGAAERGLTASFDFPASLVVETDAALLGAVLSNVFSNAVEYALPHTQIRCSAATRPAAALCCSTWRAMWCRPP